MPAPLDTGAEAPSDRLNFVFDDNGKRLRVRLDLSRAEVRSLSREALADLQAGLAAITRAGRRRLLGAVRMSPQATGNELRDFSIAALIRRQRDDDGSQAAWNAAYPFLEAIDALPSEGGTIGPLPDGTVIEVERVSWDALVGPENWSASTTLDEIVAAFNAQEGASHG